MDSNMKSITYRRPFAGTSYRTVYAGKARIGSVEYHGRNSGCWCAWSRAGQFKQGFRARSAAASWLLATGCGVRP